jgi:hypothetical protein
MLYEQHYRVYNELKRRGMIGKRMYLKQLRCLYNILYYTDKIVVTLLNIWMIVGHLIAAAEMAQTASTVVEKKKKGGGKLDSLCASGGSVVVSNSC